MRGGKSEWTQITTSTIIKVTGTKMAPCLLFKNKLFHIVGMKTVILQT